MYNIHVIRDVYILTYYIMIITFINYILITFKITRMNLSVIVYPWLYSQEQAYYFQHVVCCTPSYW